MRHVLFTATLLASSLPLRAAEPCVTLDTRSAAALFDDWNFALSSLDASQVAQRYWPDAVLLPADSNAPRASAAAISDYFTQFLVKRPRGHVTARNIQSSCNLAVDMGTYTFSLMDDKGATSELAARYTLVYQYRDGAWKILNHQSSVMAEAAANAPAPALVASESPATTPAKPAPRKERRAKRKDYLDDPVAMTKPQAKPAAKPAADVKPTADTKPSDEAKATAEAKSAKESTPAADAKSAAKAAPDGKAAAAAKPTPDAQPNAAVQPPADARSESRPEVRTAMFANLTSSPPPSKFYPPEAMRHKERGNVNLKVCADGTGELSDNMEVLKSSGSRLLDEAAIAWAHAVDWVPATYNRKRVEGCAKVDVWFEPPPGLAQSRN